MCDRTRRAGSVIDHRIQRRGHLPALSFRRRAKLTKTLSLAGDSQLNYIRFELEADDIEFRFPPTAHFIATVEDLTDMLDYGSKDIDGMDDDAYEEQGLNPPFTGRWTATSLYDVYMVDTPKETNDDDKEDPVKDKPPETQPKCRR